MSSTEALNTAGLDLTLADMQHLTEMGISLSLVTRCAAA